MLSIWKILQHVVWVTNSKRYISPLTYLRPNHILGGQDLQGGSYLSSEITVLPKHHVKFIIKRDGRTVPYSSEKIYTAVKKAALHIGCDLEVVRRVTDRVEYYLDELFVDLAPHVENIQDLVVKSMEDFKLYELKDAYVDYREQRNRIRRSTSTLHKKLESIIRNPERGVEANANVGSNFSAKLLLGASEAFKEFYLDAVIPEHLALAHRSGQIHIHDLDSYGATINCLQIPFGKIWAQDGINTGYGWLRRAKRIGSALAQEAIIFQANQNDMFGGQSDPRFEEAAVFIPEEYETLAAIEQLTAEQALRKKAIERETYQACEALVHNLNTMHSRAGSQVPFSSINLGCPRNAREKMLTWQFLEAFNAGLGRGETPIFPNVVFRLKAGVNFNPEDDHYDLYQLALRVAGRRMNPTFSFMDSSFNSPYQDKVAYMGCRSRVIANRHGKSVPEGRGNIAPVSINLPRLALEAEGPLGNKNLRSFWANFNEVLLLCEEQLLHRVEVLKQLKVQDLPFTLGQGLYMDSENLSSDDSIWEAIKHGTVSIGYIGLAECLYALIGHHHGECREAHELGLEIAAHLRLFCENMGHRTNLNVTCYATPAEGLSGRFVQIDREKYGIIPGVTEYEFYTNSFHVPVYYSISIADKIAVEGPFHKFHDAGHISYIELDAPLEHNPQALEKIHRLMSEADMGYAGVNFPIDECESCAHHGILGNTCPVCGSTQINRVRRVTGYLSYVHRFATGKKSEFENRRPHH